MEHKWATFSNVAICFSIVAVIVGISWAFAWAKVQNEPMYATGITDQNRPWCQSRDPQRPCPLYESKISTEFAIK